MEQTRPQDPPLAIWIVTLNRPVHRDVRFRRKFYQRLAFDDALLRNALCAPNSLMLNRRQKQITSQIAMKLFVSLSMTNDQ